MPRYSREAKLEMIRLYHEEHRSVNWIAEHYGISQSYLRHLLEMDAKGMAKDIGTGQSGKPKGRYSDKFFKGVPAEKFSKLTASLFPTKVDVLPAPVVQLLINIVPSATPPTR